MTVISSISSNDLNKIKDIDVKEIYNTQNTDKTKEILNTLNLNEKLFYFKDDVYKLIKYDKEKLKKKDFKSIGLYRSILCKNDKIVCFAPPKSLCIDDFINSCDINRIQIEEFIDGTMINLFWSGTEWEITTKSSLGGNVSFYIMEEDDKKEKTFRWMFLDTLNFYEEKCNEEGSNFFECVDKIPKNLCLSFVVQHPTNRIVVPHKEPSLYLTKCYEIDNNIIKEKDINILRNKLPKWVNFPLVYDMEIEEAIQNIDLKVNDYKNMGYIILGIDQESHAPIRTKLRNYNYELVRKLRGNQPKLQYRYLMLNKEGKIKAYLKYYPEHGDKFLKYRDLLYNYTNNLLKLYRSCYVKKDKKLKEYPEEYRTNMFKLHELYLSELIQNKQFVDKKIVIDYINNLEPALLMHCINYQFKKSINDI